MLILIRGAGDLATGIALRLYRSGLKIVMTDLAQPTAIRRTVAFSQCLLNENGITEVEGVKAQKATTQEVPALLEQGIVPVLADPNAESISVLHPDCVVDAILAKRNLGTCITDAPVVIGVGPGFTAGEDCHAVVETMRGHTLGRVYYHGSALPNTAIPGLIGGYAGERVLRAPESGIFHPLHEIGDLVEAGESVGEVEGVPMKATISGMLRGLLPDGVPVQKGMKSGDVDPRGVKADYTTASDKALAVGGGVLEAVLHLSGVLR